MNQEMLHTVATVIVILIIASLSVYVFFAGYEFVQTGRRDHTSFINNIIFFSMFWMLVSVIVVLTCIFSYFEKFNRYCVMLFAFGFIVITVIVVSAADFFRKKLLSPVPVVPVCGIMSMLILLLVTFDDHLYLILKIVLFVYSIFNIVFTIITSRNNPQMSKTGVLYTLSGIAVAIFNIMLTDWWGTEFSLMLDLALSVMLAFGFFFYYCEIYSISIEQKVKKIQGKNIQLMEAEKKIFELAFIDQETGLKNINQLQADLEAIVSDKKSQACIILLWIENFRTFNSHIGYSEGNAIFSKLADRVKSVMLDNDELYRFCFDKLIIIHFGNQNSCKAAVRKIADVLSGISFNSIPLNSYCGISAWPGKSGNFDVLIKELELAMLRAKEDNCLYFCYNDRLNRESQAKLMLESNLRDAVAKKEWEVYLQPKASFEDDSIIGAEALIRWKNKKISPSVFIPLSEQLGLIGEIGKHVIDTAFEYQKALHSMTGRWINISINLSPFQLTDPSFMEYVRECFQRHGIEPQNITFEITESVLIDNFAKLNGTISKLRKLGFLFSLDDFGTGYSSLSYISKLNLDEIKFDMSFTQSLPHNRKNFTIMEAIASMSKKLGVNVTIEGVELKEQYDCAKQLNCDAYQGYFRSKPVPFEEFACMLEN